MSHKSRGKAGNMSLNPAVTVEQDRCRQIVSCHLTRAVLQKTIPAQNACLPLLDLLYRHGALQNRPCHWSWYDLAYKHCAFQNWPGQWSWYNVASMKTGREIGEQVCRKGKGAMNRQASRGGRQRKTGKQKVPRLFERSMQVTEAYWNS